MTDKATLVEQYRAARERYLRDTPQDGAVTDAARDLIHAADRLAYAMPTAEAATLNDAETEYWTAGRDSHGNIRLNCGRGWLVAHAAATRAEVQIWHDNATNDLRRDRYAAALELFDREATQKENQ